MGNLRIAVKALAAHRLRSILAMLGVFLGTLVLTAITHIGAAMMEQADEETQKLGPNLVQVRAGRIRFAREDTEGSKSTGSITTLTMADAADVARSIPQVRQMAPYTDTAKPVRHGGTQTNSQLLGVTRSYQDVRALELLVGRFITQADEDGLELVCVMGNAIAERLFGRPELAEGRVVFVGTVQLTVVGIIDPKGGDLGGASFDEQVFVPLRTYMRRITNVDRINGFYLNLHDGSNIQAAKDSITRLLRQRHKIGPGKRDDFRVSSAEDAAQLRTETMDLVRGLGIMSASISFAVGGLGIFSIMILMVRARQMEIGIRRAVGASRKKIIRQFLAEAALMSGSGGILGVAVGLGLVTVIYSFASFPYVYEPLFCLGASLASVLLGVAAGAWPAWQASRVEVLSALKSWG